jgi:hypothetical protein
LKDKNPRTPNQIRNDLQREALVNKDDESNVGPKEPVKLGAFRKKMNFNFDTSMPQEGVS